MAPSAPAPGPASWRTDISHLDGLSTAALATDASGVVVHCNTAAERLLARPRGQLVGRGFQDLLPADHSAAGQQVLARALAGEPWSGSLEVEVPADQRLPTGVSASPLWCDDEVCGALLLLERLHAEDSAAGRAEQVADRLTRLTRVTAELVTADDMETVTRAVVSRTADAAGATIAALIRRVDDATLALVGIRGTTEVVATKYATFPNTDAMPAGYVIRRREPLIITGRDRIEQRFPGAYDDTEGRDDNTLVALPLNVGARTLGAIVLSFPGRRTVDAAEQEFLDLLAATCAQAMDRIDAVAEAEDRAYKLRFLSESSAELSSSLDYEETLRRVAWLGVPEFADWCSVALLEDGDLRTLQVAHVDPDKLAFVEELQRRYPADPEAEHGAWAVVKSGCSELIPVITDELLEQSAVDAEHLRLIRELELRSAVSAPLTAHGKVLGVMTWVSSDPERVFDPADLAFVEDLAQRAAVAIDNAHLHSQTREAAVGLQRAVLPDRLAPQAGWDFASYYSPSGRTEVGGDFYDVLPVDGGVVLFVGDVMGRGVNAAAAMAQMRAAVRSYAALDPSPEQVMERLDTMFELFDYSQLVTLVYVLAGTDSDELTVVSAGHPPPLVLRQDGSVDWAPGPVGPPLGVGPRQRPAFRMPLLPDDALLLYTDGLIERRTEDIDVGQQRLASAVAEPGAGRLGQDLERLVESVRDHTREDDVAALVARRLPRA